MRARLAGAMRDLAVWLLDASERLDPTPDLSQEEYDRMRATLLLAKELLADDPWAELRSDLHGGSNGA